MRNIKIKRTPLLTECVKEIDAINDLLCFTAFMHHEMPDAIKMTPAVNSKDDDILTTDLFPENPFVKRISVRSRRMPEFTNKSINTSIRICVIYAYEHLANYLKSIMKFKFELESIGVNVSTSDTIEDEIKQRITNWIDDEPDSLIFTTIGYLRVLRNSFSHVNDKSSKQLSTYTKTHGHQLNNNWNNRPAKLGKLDFTSFTTKKICFLDAFALINLVRICAKEIDALVASTLNEEVLIENAVTKVWEQNPNYRNNPKRLSSKAYRLLKLDYGFEAESEMLFKALSAKTC